MTFVSFMKKQAEELEEMKKALFELQYGLEGMEVEYEGRTAIVMTVDWKEKAVLLNYDDVNMEWVLFK